MSKKTTNFASPNQANRLFSQPAIGGCMYLDSVFNHNEGSLCAQLRAQETHQNLHLLLRS